MGAWAGVGFVVLFSAVNVLLWGNTGDSIKLLSISVPAYSLVWIWIGLIAFIFGTNYAITGKSTHTVGNLISVWWASNIGMTTLLNSIEPRGVEETGGTVFELPGIILDFVGQASVDLAALVVIGLMVSRYALKASMGVVILCGFLVANLFGHVAGAYSLLTEVGLDSVAKSYDSYMYFVFTIMLLLQGMGAGFDAIIRWTGSHVDLYDDIRPFISRVAHRYLHLQ